jgi:CheY-like chemotaxis protein
MEHVNRKHRGDEAQGPPDAAPTTEEDCFSLESSLKPQMPVSEKKILAVMTDLFFAAKINDIAKKLGMSVEFLKDKDAVLEKVKAKPAVVIFDLNYEALDPVAVIKAIKADPATKRVSTIGFVSHVQTELKLRAQDAGCDMVVARSVFATNLPMILKRHATIEVKAG